jgi:hypothetical protein
MSVILVRQDYRYYEIRGKRELKDDRMLHYLKPIPEYENRVLCVTTVSDTNPMKSSTPISRSEVLARGYQPCSVCNP